MMSWVYFGVFVVVILIGIIVGFALWQRQKRAHRLVREKIALGAAGAWLKTAPEISTPQYAEFEGEKVYYIQAGRGPDLVLLHGIGASIFTWRFLIKPLAIHFRVTACDLPGFGRSGKDVRGDYGLDAQRKRVNRFLDHMNIKSACLVGSSMGGAIALWMAHENPERYPKVAALAAATSPELIPKQLSRAAFLAPYAYRALNPRVMKFILSNVVAKPDLVTTESIAAYLEPFQDKGISIKTFVAALQLLGDRRMPKCFEGLRSKVLLIQGERDRMVTMRSFNRLRKVIPTAQSVVSQTGGHHIMEDEPEWTISELLRFLKPGVSDDFSGA
jgi:pimeloyl-ACP methyl ester carboxylesterase